MYATYIIFFMVFFLYDGMKFFKHNNNNNNNNNSLLFLFSSSFCYCSGYPLQHNYINHNIRQLVHQYLYKNNNNDNIHQCRISSYCTFLQAPGSKRRRRTTTPTITEISAPQRLKKLDSLFGIPLQNNVVFFSDTDSTFTNINNSNGLNASSVIDTSTITTTSSTGSRVISTVGQRGKRGNDFYSKYNVTRDITPNYDNEERNNHIRFVRYRARVAYDGTNFAGFQLQSAPSSVSLVSSSINNNTNSSMNTNNSTNSTNTNRRSRRKAFLRDSNKDKNIINNNNNQNEKRTVQGVLEDVLTQRLLHKCNSNKKKNNDDDTNDTTISIIRVIAAGRTDAGVHANGQAIHFDIPIQHETLTLKENNNDNINNKSSNSINYENPTQEQLHTIEYSINQMLPYDIRIYKLQIAPSYVTKPNKQQQNIVTNTVSTSRLQSSNTMLNNDASTSNNIDNDTTDTTTIFVEKNYTWNVMYDSTHKLYSYRLSFDKVMDPIERYNRWHPDWYISHNTTCPYNIQHLEQLLQYYVGTHDYRAFAGSIDRLEAQLKLLKLSQVQHQKSDNDSNETGDEKVFSLDDEHPLNTIRTVYSITLVKEDDEHDIDNNNKNNYRIDFIVKGALYKQIRNMVGTVLDVCRGRMTETKFRSLLMLDDNNDNTTTVISSTNSTDASSPSSRNITSTAPIMQKKKQQKQKQSRCDNPSKPAPAHGLTLEYVYFDNDPTGF